MRVNIFDLNNVSECIQEVMSNLEVDIDFQDNCKTMDGEKQRVTLGITETENGDIVFAEDFDDIFKLYPVLLGIYYGMCIAKDKMFDYTPVPASKEW